MIIEMVILRKIDLATISKAFLYSSPKTLVRKELHFLIANYYFEYILLFQLCMVVSILHSEVNLILCSTPSPPLPLTYLFFSWEGEGAVCSPSLQVFYPTGTHSI